MEFTLYNYITQIYEWYNEMLEIFFHVNLHRLSVLDQ